MVRKAFTTEKTEVLPVDGLAKLDIQLLGKLNNNNYICKVGSYLVDKFGV